MFNLAILLEETDQTQEAEEWFLAAAENGSTDAYSVVDIAHAEEENFAEDQRAP